MITAVSGRAAHVIVELLSADRRGVSQIDVKSRGQRARRHQQIVSAEELDHPPIERGALALGAGNVGRRLGKTALGVPDDVGLQLVAVAPELQLAVDDEVLAAQDMERLVRRADIGRGFLDDASQLLEAPRCLGADLAHLAIDRHAAVIVGGERDALGSDGLGQAVAEGDCRRVEGQRVVRAEARHRVEEQRQVGDAARHRPLHRELAPEIVDGAARHAARRRPQADNRAVAARAAQRAAMVGALRQPDLAGRHRHRAAAGRAARGQRGVPGIARPAEDLVEGAAAGAEFGRVRLAHHDAALALDALDQRVRFRRHVIGEQRRAVGGADARDIGEVLDRYRQAGEPACLAGGSRRPRRPA